MANTFSTSQIIDEVQKVKLPSHNGFSDSDRVAKKMDKVELRGDRKSRCYIKNIQMLVNNDFWLKLTPMAKGCHGGTNRVVSQRYAAGFPDPGDWLSWSPHLVGLALGFSPGASL
ncbi:hypothetical protein [Scytonema sp. HK-05]|uniref:hypothetical protein n=1 Tax=Scytonema sp. HK-05 TaxID=1137095 RepID=UPI0009368B84|nr:hypothetical protein [Scytonema sp. HK-05]OKH60048.1 hypothetical protein NIES2130_06240 [Scytonema sp. HK-05]